MRLSDRLKEFLATCEGREVSLKYLRDELRIDPNSPAWNGLREYLRQLTDKKIVKPSGRNDGIYKVIRRVNPVSVFGAQRFPPIQIVFPKDFDTGMEMEFSEHLVIRQGDLILLSGMSNQGKTTLCLNFAGENIDQHPVLMGNEYTTIDNLPNSRFMDRLDKMSWVEWVNGTGEDKFVLLPVREDYAEHIVKDKINIIDWINVSTGEHYMIGSILEGIKRELGKGVAIIAIQKAEGAVAGRGGQFTKDFADIELLIDKMPNSFDAMMTLGKVKESTKPIMGKTYAYHIVGGVKITNFREVVKCKSCYGKGWKDGKICDDCLQTGYKDK